MNSLKGESVIVTYWVERFDNGPPGWDSRFVLWRQVAGQTAEAFKIGKSQRIRYFPTRSDAEAQYRRSEQADRAAATRIGVDVVAVFKV